MIPLRDVIPSRTIPYVARALIAVHALVLLADGRPGRAVLNGVYLWLFGETVEDRTGHARFLACALLCGGCAVGVQCAASEGSTAAALGANGVVAGVLGGYLVLYPASRVITLVPIPFLVRFIEVPFVVFLTVWVFTLLADRPTAAAQLAAFGTGALAVLALHRRDRMRVEWWSHAHRG